MSERSVSRSLGKLHRLGVLSWEPNTRRGSSKLSLHSGQPLSPDHSGQPLSPATEKPSREAEGSSLRSEPSKHTSAQAPANAGITPASLNGSLTEKQVSRDNLLVPSDLASKPDNGKLTVVIVKTVTPKDGEKVYLMRDDEGRVFKWHWKDGGNALAQAMVEAERIGYPVRLTLRDGWVKAIEAVEA